MMFNLNGLGYAMIALGVVIAIAGWAAIEAIIWLFSFIHFS